MPKVRSGTFRCVRVRVAGDVFQLALPLEWDRQMKRAFVFLAQPAVRRYRAAKVREFDLPWSLHFPQGVRSAVTAVTLVVTVQLSGAVISHAVSSLGL